MVLGPKILLNLVKKKKLVENLSERELTNPEGAGFDLRLGAVYKIKGKGFLGIDDRQTPESVLVAKFDPKKRSKVVFKPGDFFLVQTIESFNIPGDMTANFKPRTTTFRSGLNLRTGNVAPGYSGQVAFGMKNDGPCEVTIELGARFVHVQFEMVDGGGSKYRGQWQGGRVSAVKREKQV